MSTKTIAAALLAAAALLGTAGSASAQVALEPRLDVAIPVGDSRDQVDAGVGFGVNAELYLTPLFAVYGGYSRTELDGKGLLEDAEVDEDGWHAGGKVLLGTGGGVTMPFVQLGAVFREDETGFEAGAGLEYGVGGNLSVTPRAMYRSVGGLDYVSVGLGAKLTL